MSIQIADNFSYLGEKPLDARLKYNTIAEMKEVTSTSLYDGCLAYVTNEHKYYTYDSANDVDVTLGKWREFEVGTSIEVDDVIDDTSENPVQNKVIAEALDDKADAIDIGDLTELETTAKSDLVSAINEVNSKEIPTIQIDELPTASVDELDNIYQYVGMTDDDYTNGYFYKCVEGETAGTYEWVAVQVQEGGTGSGALQRDITAAIEVGGIDVGDEFAIGTSYDDMWDALLNPTLYPTFTNPSASLSYSADTYYEVGTSIAAKSATASLNRGSISPAYGTNGYRSGEATNYALATSGADTEYSDSSTSSGIFSVPALTRATKGNIVLTATVSYAAGEQPKDSKGNNYDSPLAAGSKTASKTMQFIQPYYYGKSATSTVSNFTGLTKSVTAKGQKQFKFTTNNEYMVIAYDSSYGNLSSIIDPNGFETISGWTKSTLTVGGFSYFVYVANSATTDTNAQFTFKY